MMPYKQFLVFTGCCLFAGLSLASELTVPNKFRANTSAVAAEVNANFDAVKSAVDDNYNRITTNATDITALEARITALEAHVSDTANPHAVTKSQVGLGNVENIQVRFTATTSPTTTDDNSAGYTEGALWVNTSTTQAYVLLDGTVNAAEWREITRTYQVGDTGPAGGIVFYVTDGGTHGLEAAPEDQSTGAPWCSTFDNISGATSSDFGDGPANTVAILEGCSGGTNGIAARLADDYVLNGFHNWFLPTQDELNLLYTELHLQGMGGFVGLPYWGATQSAFDTAVARHFGNGNEGATDKGASFRVRVIRAF